MWNYLYLSSPLAAISFIAYKIKEKIDFKNLWKKITEDIKDDLRSGPSDKNGRRTISEKDCIFKDVDGTEMTVKLEDIENYNGINYCTDEYFDRK